MTIDAQLSRGQFVQLALLRHIQRAAFYIYALAAAGLTAYTITRLGNPLLLLVGWVPFLVYIGLGIINAIQGSRGEPPYLLPTHYEFANNGVAISTSAGQSDLEWDQFAQWGKMAGCYVLALHNDQIIAFPQKAVARHKADQLERLLHDRITHMTKDGN